ncbi:hypothetical protein Ancab_007228 [Ancistrocladus abbreviatus]
MSSASEILGKFLYASTLLPQKISSDPHSEINTAVNFWIWRSEFVLPYWKKLFNCYVVYMNLNLKWKLNRSSIKARGRKVKALHVTNLKLIFIGVRAALSL